MGIRANLEKTLASASVYELFGKDWPSKAIGIQVLFPNLIPGIIKLFSSKEFNSEKSTQIFEGHFPSATAAEW